MQQITPREQVLKKIRQSALNKKVDMLKEDESSYDTSSPIFKNPDSEAEVEFAKNLKAKGGEFIYCFNDKELVKHLKALFKEKNWQTVFSDDKDLLQFAEAIKLNPEKKKITDKKPVVFLSRCEYIVSSTGSVLISSNNYDSTKLSYLNDVMIIIAERNQIKTDLKSTFESFRKKYDELPSVFTLISGPSRTADIEKKLVHGAHSSKELYVFLLE